MTDPLDRDLFRRIQDRVAIVGIGHLPFAKDIGRPIADTAVEAAQLALDDAGLVAEDVDGMVMFEMEKTHEVTIARRLGVKNLAWWSKISYGGGASAATLMQAPALIHAVAQASGPNPVHLANYNNTKEMVTTSVFCADLLWKRSQLGPKDMHCAQIYDAFTPLVITGLEDYGFCKRGEGGPFTEGGRLELGGALPVLTSGGGLSEAYVHGFNLILEGVRQIRGSSSNQVPGCKATLVTGASGVATSALVLRGE